MNEDELKINDNEENKKTNIFSKAKKAIVNKIDQNGSGSLDKEDFGIIANNIKGAASKAKSDITEKAKDGYTKISEIKKEHKLESDKKLLAPIFQEDIDSSDFGLTKMIRIGSPDKKHSENEICNGSIGHYINTKDLKICNIYPQYIDKYGIYLCPNNSAELYYADPVISNRYIELDDYFDYLRIARTTELQKIAQSLGAKYFKVTYREEKSVITSNKIHSGIEGSKQIKGELTVDHGSNTNDYSTIEVAAEMHFDGHKPEKPELIYLANSPSIQSLVEMRMNNNTLKHQIVSIKLSKIAGIKQNDAIKIDSALSSLKVKGNCSVLSEVQKEARTTLEYEIEF